MIGFSKETVWMMIRNTYELSYWYQICLGFFPFSDSSYPLWWDVISSPSLFKLFLDSPVQLSSSNVSLRSSESAIVTTCVVDFVVVGDSLAKVNWNRWMKFRSQCIDGVGIDKMHERMGIGRGLWVRSVFDPHCIVLWNIKFRAGNSFQTMDESCRPSNAKKVVFLLKSICSEDILPQWSARGQGFENILGSKCCWCQIRKSKKKVSSPLILTNHNKARGVRQVWSEALQNSRSLPKVSEDAYLLSPASIGILGAESIDGTTTLKLIRLCTPDTCPQDTKLGLKWRKMFFISSSWIIRKALKNCVMVALRLSTTMRGSFKQAGIHVQRANKTHLSRYTDHPDSQLFRIYMIWKPLLI